MRELFSVSLPVPTDLQALSDLRASGKLSGPQYVEDRLLKVAVPRWADSSGFRIFPSSQLIHLLEIIRDADAPDWVRILNLEVLCQVFRQPVAPQRRRFVMPRVRDRAEERRQAVDQVLADAIGAAVCMVQPDSSPERSFEANLRQAVNKTVTEDFLGTQWRHDFERLTDLPDAEAEAAFLQELGQEERRRLLKRLRPMLSFREQELLDAIQQGISALEWGRSQGLADTTGDSMLHRIRRKGRDLLKGERLGDL